MKDAGCFEHFDEAAHAVLEYMHEHYGFGLWMVTRVQGNDWIILQARDQDYGVDDGTVLRWSDSYCSRMTQGEGPAIATTAPQLEAYANAPINEQLDIGAYMGVPLRHDNGKLFGTLCGVDKREHPEIGREAEDTLVLIGRLLSSLLAREMRLAEHERRTRRALDKAQTDALTGLPNRRGWDERMKKENRRLKGMAGSALVLIVDLDELKEVNDSQGHQAGDTLIRKAGQAIESAVRDRDFVARIGGDEFAVLGAGTDPMAPEDLIERLRGQLAESGVSASIGGARWRPGRTLEDVSREADEAMYQDKRCRSARR